MAKRNSNLRKACPFEAAIDIIGGKWKGVILFQLMKTDSLRFNELKALIPLISQKMLTQQLRELTEAGLVLRQADSESSLRVEYSLTEIGKNLQPAFALLKEWGQQFL